MNTSVKQCRVCGVDKPVGEFYVVTTTRSGEPRALSECRGCYRERMAESRRRNWVKAAVRTAVNSAKRRSADRGVPFGITNDDANALITSQGGKCAISGLPFQRSETGVASLFSPSLDRIKPSEGYVMDNIRFILHGLNAMKGSDTDDDLIAVCRAVVENNS